MVPQLGLFCFKTKKAQAVSAVYTAADTKLDNGQEDDAVTAFVDLGKTGPDGYAGLALMRAAAILQDQGDIQGAVRYFDQAAEKFTIIRHKQLAQLKAAYLLADEGAYADVIARLGPLSETDAPYEFLSRELLGYAHDKSCSAHSETTCGAIYGAHEYNGLTCSTYAYCRARRSNRV